LQEINRSVKVSDTKSYLQRIAEGLKLSVREVMSTMAMAEVSAGSEQACAEFSVAGPAAGLMFLAGERKGMVAVSMPEALARGVIANITGLAPDTLSRQDLLDGIGELINMLSGGMKTKVADPAIQLSPPIAILGNEYAVEWKTGRPTMVLEFESSGERFTVHACVL
jgi:chemotaxis protein CheX